MGRAARVRSTEGKLRQTIEIGPHQLTSDEPESSGGDDRGPAPHELLLAALGACTSMTVKLYAERKGWPLGSVEVVLTQERRDGAYVMRKAVHLEGPLDDEQRARLVEIAAKCPVHRTLTGEIRIETTDGTLAEAAG